ncbi:MAG: MBL fold metallo-hydrolase [Leptospirales bacterium]|nr:MBL fold metallo-hydrolase [Leptospirales bacterium]
MPLLRVFRGAAVAALLSLHCRYPLSLLEPRVYAVEYGNSLYFSDLVNTSQKDPYVRMSWLFYVIVSDSRTYLVDSGIANASQAAQFRIEDFRDPVAALKPLRIDAKSVTDIILTHSHVDHVGGISLFPDAVVYIQKEELDYFKTTKRFPDFAEVMESRRRRGKLKIVNGNVNLSRNVSLERTAGHTPGSQAVRVRFVQGEAIITGDECYFIDACRKKIALPTDAAYSQQNNIAFIERIHNEKRLLTLHDPWITQNYLKQAPGIVQIY